MMISEKKLKGRIVKFSNFCLKIYRLTFFLYNEPTNAQLIDNVQYYIAPYSSYKIMKDIQYKC